MDHGRLERLWLLACHYQYSHPKQSRYFCQTIQRTSRTCDEPSSLSFRPSNSFYQAACGLCGNIYTFGKTCRARIERLSSVRKDKSGQRVVFASHLDDDQPPTPKIGGAHVMVYECLVCHSKMVFDTHPIAKVKKNDRKAVEAFEEKPPEAIGNPPEPIGKPRTLNKPKDVKLSKTEQLRRLLAKKTKTTAVEDETTPSLHSFLKSLKKT